MPGDYLVGRQPIFDSACEVLGYELLFRGDRALVGDGLRMTADVLVRATLDIGLGDVVGNKLAFVNAPRELLVGHQELPLYPEQAVVEVLEDVVHDAEVIAGCRRLVDAGYTLALDDYVWQAGDEVLLELASIVKLDVLAIPPEALAAQVDACSAFGARLVAEKIETYEQLAECRRLGFELFQGYVLCKPEVLNAASLTPSRVAVLGLINKVCDDETPIEELQSLVETDVGLSVRLLRVAGAGAGRGLRRPLGSVREAVVLLGRQRLRSWLLLMLAGDTGEAKPAQLEIPMTRAKACELVAGKMRPELAGSAFTVGILSGLDLLIGAPIADIVGHLAVDDRVSGALLERSGLLGAVLQDVLDWEVGQPPAGRSRCEAPSDVLEWAYIEALRWTTGFGGLDVRAA